MHQSQAMLEGVLEGSLIWSPDGPRPIESVGVGDLVVTFDPVRYTTDVAPVEKIRSATVRGCLELAAGGRLLSVTPGQPLPLFDIDGGWRLRPASAVEPDTWVPVDRRVPLPSHPITLPDCDERLTRLLGEDAVALADAVLAQDKYFAEMDKRGTRLRLYELSGYILAGGVLLGEHLTLDEADGTVMDYYAEVWRRTFGKLVREETVAPILRRWMGKGLLPEPHRTVPPWAWQLEGQARAAFLRGFFDLAGRVTQQEVTVDRAVPRLLVALQILLGSLGVEASVRRCEPAKGVSPYYRLCVRNVRRFAEWIDSNVPGKAARLKAVYTREPRYPMEGTAILPLNRVRPALERIRTRIPIPRQPGPEHDEMNKLEMARLSTLRLLSTAFDEPQLRTLVNRQLYLEPLGHPREQKGGTIFALSLSDPTCVVVNGLAICTYASREL